ncbi:hypothetical protein FD11_GL000498 [Ligilactobacillus pobuzihii E100301 = KCTC 13174]|uniref:Uncharacterized protein n=1 Tax=Ligilactobacillus pobuzihii TaxID=449659 RepID=A0A0R2LCL3_9LACO|nr:hypothetical protein FD11_GL000498 [Ligilactobacillus pobuzihii E100301 = KCTC 13174]KRN96778.1 hypothetical protein IV66_GL000640 [Ligilactobacillus pobuzihii]
MIIIVLFGFILHDRKTSLLKKADVKVEFGGYNDSGYMSYDRDKLAKAEMKIFTDKAKMSDYWTKELLKDPDELAEPENFDDSESMSSKDKDKMAKIYQWQKGTKINESSNGNLKNGQKVIIAIKTSDDKTNPLKSESKTYKVKGLKKVKNLNVSSFTKKLRLKVRGTNTHGYFDTVKANSSTPKVVSKHVEDTFKANHNGGLKNGDKVKTTERKIADDLNRYSDKYNFIGRKNAHVILTIDNLPTNKKNVKNLSSFIDELDELHHGDELVHVVFDQGKKSLSLIYNHGDGQYLTDNYSGVVLKEGKLKKSSSFTSYPQRRDNKDPYDDTSSSGKIYDISLK